MIGCIIQARMGSSRLPKKVMKKIDNDLTVYKNSTIYSKPIVILKKGRLCLVLKCENDWCKIKVDKYKGWVKQKSLWGRL